MKFTKIACLIVLVASITLGCSESGSTATDTKDAVAPAVQKTTTPAATATTQATATTPATGEPDEYGRLPGDAHYGHNHPPAGDEAAPIQTTTSTGTPLATPPPAGTAAPGSLGGEPDKYGRKPGDAHYGHDHP